MKYAIIVMLSCVAIATVEAKETQSYSDIFRGFKFRLPPGWSEGALQGETLIFRGEGEGAPEIKIQFRKDTRPLKDFLEAFRKSLTEADKGAKVLRETPVKGGRADGAILAIESGSRRMLFGIFDRNGRKYIFSFTADAVPFGKAVEAIERAFRSVRIFDLPELTKEDRERYRKLYEEGSELLKEKKWTEAEEFFRKASAIVPDYPDIHRVLGLVCRMAKKPAESIAAYEKALAFDGDDVDALYNLGTVLVMEKQYAKAVERLEKAHVLDPDDAKTMTNLGTALVLDKKYAKAIEVLQKAIAKEPNGAEAMYQCGFAFEMQKKPKEAGEMYRAALKADPDHEGAKEGLERLKNP